MRQHGEREEKNEFEELVSVATSLQDSKPAQILTLEWRKPHADGHRVAGTDIMSVGEPDNDSRIAAFWKRFPNVLKWYQYADSLLGNLSGWEARINLAILRMASDEEAAQRYVTQMPGKMFADYAVPSIHAWAVVLQISEVVRPGVFRSIRHIATATCEPPCTLYALVQVSFGFTVIYLLIAKSGNNVVTVAQGDGDFHKVKDGLRIGWRMR